jgi:hypothetical protein
VSPRNASRRAYLDRCGKSRAPCDPPHLGVKGGLHDVVLVEVRSVDPEASFLHA